MNETIILKKNIPVTISYLQKKDEKKLLDYFTQLSTATRSRFGPHSFDRDTVHDICNEPAGDIIRYVALNKQEEIIAYMLIKKGMNEGEQYRLRQNTIAYEESLFCTFAPSVADEWQSCGLGSAMYKTIESDIQANTVFRFIILWGGVQATNEKAIRYYEKHDFKTVGSFWYAGKNNYDMIKTIYL
jgi:diamine N-acetyltransferase